MRRCTGRAIDGLSRNSAFGRCWQCRCSARASAVGALRLRRNEVRPFTQDQIRLLETFADQAVIAIENARLFQELGQRNASFRRAITRSRGAGATDRDGRGAAGHRLVADRPPTGPRRRSSSSAARLCDAPTRASIFRVEATCAIAGCRGVTSGATGAIQHRSSRRSTSRPGLDLDRQSVTGRAFLERQTIDIVDMAEAVQTEFPADAVPSNALGYRSQVVSPAPARRASRSVC